MDYWRPASALEFAGLSGDAYRPTAPFWPSGSAGVYRASEQPGQSESAWPAADWRYGHASHQSGLDLDIWLQLPRQRWTAQQLLKLQPIDLVSANGNQVVDRQWQPRIESLIKMAAQDSEVTRIFVNPAIKQRLCQDAGTDRGWLLQHKVRPWFRHRAHMHVRLRCPTGSLECLDQDSPPAGDGCGAELASWFKPHQPNANPGKKEPPPFPPSCQALLDSHFANNR